MRIRLFIHIIILLLFYTGLQGQDLNQTNYRYAPLYLNPALAGNFLGSARVLATYRDQGRELQYDPYSTWQVFADLPVAGSFTEGDWSGLGIGFYSDKAGKLPVSTQGIFANLAYHLSLDKKQNRILSAGIQYGMVQRKMDDKSIILESDHVDPGVFLTDRTQFAAYEEYYNDLNVGINLRLTRGTTQSFNFGVAAYHLLQTNAKFLPEPNFYNRRYSAYTSYLFGLSKRVFLQPEITFSMSGNARNLMPQVKSFFKLGKDKKKNDMLYFGAGYRVNDALQLMFGLNVMNWDVGIAYDITVSSASGYNNGRGGFEIGVFRIIEIPQKPTVIPTRVCPRL